MRDQVEALRRRGDVEVERLRASPPGTRGYRARGAGAAPPLRAARRFDVVHAHFGLTAWPALAAGLGPLVVTLHGNDLLPPALEAGHPRGAAAASTSPPRSPARSRARPRRRPHAARRGAPVRGRPRRASGRSPAREARARLGLDPDGPYLLFPHDPAAAAQALRPRAGGRRRRAAAHAGRRPARTRSRTGSTPPTPSSSPPRPRASGSRCIEALACDVPAFGTPVGIHPVALEGIEGAVCRRSTADAGAAASRRTSRPPTRAVDGRARRAVLGGPHGRARGRRRGASARARKAAGGPPILARPGVPRVPAIMSGLLRRIRRPGAAEETRRSRRAPRSGPRRPRRPRHRRGRAAPARRASTPPTSTPQPTGRRRKLRRRARFLRSVRELLLRDLGGLVYETRRASRTPSSSRHEKVAASSSGARRGAARARRRASARRAARPCCASPASAAPAPPAASCTASEARFCSTAARPGPAARVPPRRRPSGARRAEQAAAAAAAAQAEAGPRPRTAAPSGRRPAQRRRRRRRGRRRRTQPAARTPAPTQPTEAHARRDEPGAGNGRIDAGRPTEAAEPGDRHRSRDRRRDPPARRRAAAARCPRCGAALAPDQEWCLSCGTAVGTRIAPSPGWRMPVVIVALLALIARGARAGARRAVGDRSRSRRRLPRPATPAARPTRAPRRRAPTTPRADARPRRHARPAPDGA